MWVPAILTSRSDIRATKDLRGDRHTPNMKEGWLCRTSYDEILHTWWWPEMIQIELWSRSSYDDSERSRSRDDLDPAVVIQIDWWSRSSSVMMIQIEWWSRFSDDDQDREMIQIQMTWRWRWLEDKHDPMIQRRRPVLKIVSKEYLPS